MRFVFNPLNADLIPICHLLALLGAHHILHVSRIRVKGLSKENYSNGCICILYAMTELKYKSYRG